MNHINLDAAMYANRFLEMGKSLSRRGHEVQLIVPSIRKEKRAVFGQSVNIKYLFAIHDPYPASLTFPISAFFYLFKSLKEKPPSFMIADPPSLFATLGVMRHSSGVKFVLDIRSPPVLDGVRGLMERAQYYAAISIAKRFYDGITVISLALQKDLASRLAIDSSKIGVWTSGVSTELFDYDNCKKASRELRKELGFEHKFIVMYHGSLREDLFETLKAIEKLAPSHNDLLLFILGSGIDENLLKKMVKEKKIEANVYFHMPVSYASVPIFIGMCDVGIVPLSRKYWHSSALKSLEYLAMEKPIIATNLLFHQELLEHGHCGILIPSNNSEQIAGAIKMVYGDRTQVEQMGKNGRLVVEQYYSWDSKARDLEDFVKRL